VSTPKNKASLRVYFITHADGRKTGYLMRKWGSFFDAPPSAYGATEADVLAELEAQLQEKLVKGEALTQYLWTDGFGVRTVSLALHPLAMVKKQPVIGVRELPLRLTYAWTKLETGAFRVMLPRFDWWLIVESLDIAKEALTHAVAGALLGAEPKWIYDFRKEGEEYVREWTPGLLKDERGRDLGSEIPATDRETLRSVADDWVDRAARGRLPKPVGVPRVILRGPKVTASPRPSLLLVGAPGVGKTTEVQFLARQILKWKREKKDADVPGLWATRADRLLAGMIYVGMWQERILALVDELSHEGDYLYVDRLMPLLTSQPDGASIADLLGPSVRSGAVSLIAECSPAELAQASRANASFVELFHRLHLPEMDTAGLLPLVDAYARRGKRRIHLRANKRMIQVLDAFRRDRRFPGKAFRFVDAIQRDDEAPDELYAPDVEAAFARWSGLPEELISDSKAAGLEHIAGRLRERVVGQDAACLQAARAIAPFKAGLNPPDRPIGSLLFVGPTGVGKTELAKQITRYMFGSTDRLVRIDMSELMVAGAAQRLLQVGRGVRSLAESVRREPLSVVLFDEVEKAHPEVFDLLLGLLGEARLTDATGRLVDFRMTLLIMTSNLGVRETEAVGFGAGTGSEDFLRAVRDHFRPELVGRIDQVVPFGQLAPEDVRRIVDLELGRVAEREGLRRRGVSLAIDDAARDRLAELGYDRKFGARPLKRAIEACVITPVAVLLAGDPKLRDVTIRVGGTADADVVV